MPPDIDDLLAREFALDAEIIYLNHAAVAPWPRRTADAVHAFARENAAHGARDYAHWLDVESRLRARLARLLRAGETDIALAKNTSEALSMVAHGFPWREGDNVVMGADDFPSNRIPWESLVRYGVATRPVAWASEKEPEAALEAAADRNTRLMSVSAVHYATGLKLDLARLGNFCRKRSIAFCVDAIQSLGVVPHDVDAMHIDFLAADGHKWLCAPEGLAVFYVAPVWRERLALHEYGWHMLETPHAFDAPQWRPAMSARRFECGSPNMLGIHALEASLSLWEECGAGRLGARAIERAATLLAALKGRPDFVVHTPCARERHAGIVSFTPLKTALSVLGARLTAHHIVHAERRGAIRLSPHGYTTTTQLEEVLEVTFS